MQDHLDKVACWEEGVEDAENKLHLDLDLWYQNQRRLVISDEIQGWSLFTAQSFLQTAPD